MPSSRSWPSRPQRGLGGDVPLREERINPHTRSRQLIAAIDAPRSQITASKPLRCAARDLHLPGVALFREFVTCAVGVALAAFEALRLTAREILVPAVAVGAARTTKALQLAAISIARAEAVASAAHGWLELLLGARRAVSLHRRCRTTAAIPLFVRNAFYDRRFTRLRRKITDVQITYTLPLVTVFLDTNRRAGHLLLR